MAKFTITDITEWTRDDHEMAGDSCHMPESDVYYRLAAEMRKKVEEDEWPGLPFTCEAEDEDEALEKYRRKFCDGDYITPCDADIEVEGEDDDDEEEEAAPSEKARKYEVVVVFDDVEYHADGHTYLVDAANEAEAIEKAENLFRDSDDQDGKIVSVYVDREVPESEWATMEKLYNDQSADEK